MEGWTDDEPITLKRNRFVTGLLTLDGKRNRIFIGSVHADRQRNQVTLALRRKVTGFRLVTFLI